MNDSEFLCRESALLAFNRRVLAQAEDESVPLLERLRFVCIVSSNLDEFFEVRVAALKRLEKLEPRTPLLNGQLPHQVLNEVNVLVRELIADQYALLAHTILPALRRENIIFYKRNEWTPAQRAWIEAYFHHEIKPVITPIGLDPAHPFPKTLNKSLNFAVELSGKDAFGRASNMAIVQAPRILPRLVMLPENLCEGKQGLVFLSSIMHEHIQTVFLGMEVRGFHQFRLTRDSELTVNEGLNNLRTAIQGELHDRQYGSGVRLEIATKCPQHVSDFLLEQFQLDDDDLYRVDGPVNLVRLAAVPEMLARPDLTFPALQPATPKALKNPAVIFDTIGTRDILLHHPYESFQPVVDFLTQAAHDPDVVAIKMTIYRTGKKSDLIRALIAAALAGKEVTVVVELMARFDEEANVNWASQLEEAGAHVVYGVFGYKVHAKMMLVVRRENGELKRYAHLGTGNYHQGTSRIYTDFGLLTADEHITSDVNDLFIQITGLGQAGRLSKLYQSPFTLHPMIMDAIAREAENARAGKPAKIMAKMNALLEPQVIAALCEASAAGVQIDLIVRGMCALPPGVKGLSENIRVRSIIGQLLEHSRVFYFHNDGLENLYIASADWMSRNFFERVETCVPISDPRLKQRVIREAFTLALADNARAWLMQPDGSYIRVPRAADEEVINMQEILLNEYQP
ncbi:MAG: polyphosphate kinase 1 [Neisseria sp.]|nr:polyphosphate kinase 1 [Neisseria sp.]